MKCEKIQGLFIEEWSGALDAPSRTLLKSHLSECASCREEWESLSRLWDTLGCIGAEEPGPAVRDRFYAMLEDHRNGKERDRMVRPHPPGPGMQWGGLFSLKPAFQFGFTAALLVAGFFAGYALRSSRNGNEELAGLRKEVHEMRQMVTISLLKQQSASERLKGVSWSRQVSRPDPVFLSTLMHTLDYDSNVDVRLAAVDALSHFAADPAVRSGLVKSLQKQNSPLVQISLIDLLVQLQERRSIDALRQLADDAGQNPQVRQRAEWGLKKLT